MAPGAWKSILVGVREPGQRKQIAVRKAARIAAASGARLTLFHAFAAPYPLPEPIPTTAREVLRVVARERRAELLHLARPLRAAGLKVQCEVIWDFPPAQAIVRRVLENKPDLVVAESHRHSRLARWFLANSDWDLIRECPCPVWFVKNGRFAKSPLLLTAIDPAHARAKPSGLDDRLVQTATSAMRPLGGRIALIHVDEAPRAATKAAIDRLAGRHGVSTASRIIRPGSPAGVLTASAAQLKADVLVMGAVSRSGLDGAFIGNTAEAVIDEVACDVLVVKPRSFRTSVPRNRPRLPV